MSSTGQEGVISSGGSDSGSTGVPGAVAGGGAVGGGDTGSADPPAEPEAQPGTPVTWQVHTDPRFHFSIAYPDAYVILNEPDQLSGITPQPVQRVRFLNKTTAAGELADRAPADFAVEVFENTGHVPLEAWLDANAPQGTRTAATVGNTTGYEVALQIMLAPNRFYYVARGDYVYKLTPLGQYSVEMQTSFKLNP